MTDDRVAKTVAYLRGQSEAERSLAANRSVVASLRREIADLDAAQREFELLTKLKQDTSTTRHTLEDEIAALNERIEFEERRLCLLCSPLAPGECSQRRQKECLEQLRSRRLTAGAADQSRLLE